MRNTTAKSIFIILLILFGGDLFALDGYFITREEKETKKEKERQELQKNFEL